MVCVRGLHNKGALRIALRANGVEQRFGALEAPEEIGRAERRGDIFKKNLRKVVKVHSVRGKKQMKLAASQVQLTGNTTMKRGGIPAASWVLGKHPRIPGQQTEEDELG